MAVLGVNAAAGALTEERMKMQKDHTLWQSGA